MKGLRADTFFTHEERERIKAATHEAESRTIGEIAVMVVESSDRYIEAEIIGGVILGSLFSLIITVLFFHSSLWSYIPLSFVFYFPSFFLFKMQPGLRTAFIGHTRKTHAVRQRALRAFYEKGLYKTRHNTGVLFFVSQLERKVWVLADKGIHEKISQEPLNKLAQSVSQGIREGRACDALCEAIKEAGDLLAGHFPKTPEDTDELPDKVMSG